MSIASQLPLELVQAILATDHQIQPDNHFLRSCSLVCNAWSTSAQHLLFANVVIRSERDFYSFRNAILSQPTLANAVRSLRVIIDHKRPNGLRQHHLARAVALCPRLNSLSLSTFGCDSFDVVHSNTTNPNSSRLVVSAPLLHKVRTPERMFPAPITSLDFSNWSSNPHTLFHLLASFPSIKHLSITGTPPLVTTTTTLPPCTQSLTHLRINFQQSPSVDFLRWLLDNSRDTLTSLDLERLSNSDTSIGLLDFLMTTHGPALQSLVLPSCTTPTELKHFQRCTNLRLVAFRTPNVSSVVFKHLLAETRLPMEEIYLCLDKNTVLGPIIELVKSRETLKSLVVFLWEDGLRQKLRLWGSLKMACAVSGVELKVMETLGDYRTLIARLPS